MIRWHVISAVFKRNVMSYFSGLIGYLFIIVFVVASTYFTFQPEFFTDNLPTLDHLTKIFPWLLLFIVPAITMNIWAEERRSGTDELLFTLPGTDTEIVIGKYLSVVTIFTIALFFSTTQMFVMISLSQDVDWGVIFTTYLGYWMAGCSLLTAGMLASSLTKSTPVAFVLGAIFCVIPVGLSSLDATSDFLRLFTVEENLRDFAIGLISLSGVMYFVSFAGFMLYLNFIVISYRHWSSSTQFGVISNYFTRAVCLLAIFVSLTYAATYAIQPADLSEEGLYTLSDNTFELVENIDEERPVEIQAFISPEVPREYLETRKTLISLLDRLDRLGGDKITVRRVEVTPFDENSDEAETLGIQPISIPQEINGRVKPVDVFLGALVRSSYDEVVLPYFGKGVPLEYELARAIGTVSKKQRLKIGILKTDANIASEEQSGRGGEWMLTQMLRQHYDVSVVDPANPLIAEDSDDEAKNANEAATPEDSDGEDAEKPEPIEFDVLLAVMPSSLTEPEMVNFLEYVKSGRPTLIFDDPLPLFMSRLLGDRRSRMLMAAPRVPKPSNQQNMQMMQMMGGQAPPPVPKADNGKLTRLMDYLQVAWEYDEVVWDQYNPHLELQLDFPYVFVSNEAAKYHTFNDDSPITSGMQELLVICGGAVQPRENMNKDRTFTQLLTTSKNSGVQEWDDIVRTVPDPQTRQMMSIFQPVDNSEPDDRNYALAAHIQEEGKVNVIFASDIDMISDVFFAIREQGDLPLELDNVSFVMNCVDELAGDDSYLELRKRRPTMRTLTALQEQRDQFIQEKKEQERKAEKDAEEEIEQAQARFDEEKEKIRDNPELSDRLKREKLIELAERETKRLELAGQDIDREKQKEIRTITRNMERRIRSVEQAARYRALLLSPLPAVILGLAMMLTILISEKKNVSPERAVK